MDILKVISLKKIYGKNENKCEALKGINLSIENGKFTAIVGASGSGKSTLLHCMAGLDKPTDGKVLLNEEDIYKLSDEKLSALRREKLGFIFQSFNLIPVINIYENIVLPITLDNKKVDKEYIDKIVIILGIQDKMNKFPNELSGGQQQRVAIARALANRPQIIFADEPTGNLDSKSTEDVVYLLKACVEKFGQTLVMITHNNDIAKLADVCITIKDGQISNDYNEVCFTV